MNSLATDPEPPAGRRSPRRTRPAPPQSDATPGARRAPGRAADAPQVGPTAVPVPRRVREMSTRELGQAGEDLAAAHLESCGWQIVERNLRLRHGELDIVALAHTTLVFVEVKTRRTVVTGVPQAAVTHDKMRRLRRLAGEYLMERSTPHRDVRIDVVAVHAHLDGTFSLEHLEAVS